MLTRRLVLRASVVVLPSRTLCGIARDSWKLPERCIRYIPNGIDLARFAGQGKAREAGTAPVVGTVAALRPEKNLARMLRAFALVAPPDGSAPPRLEIVGDGPERPALQALAADLDIAGRLTFHGHQPEPSRFYSGFDVFALSSDTEQMPLTVLEAMAAGLPVAATDVGDVAAMLADANRGYVTPRDDAALAAALTALTADPGLAAGIGAANRAAAEARYDQETMFTAYAALFDG